MKIKRAQLSDLPSKFDINRYDVCSGWDLGTWVANIGARLACRAYVNGRTITSTHSTTAMAALKSYAPIVTGFFDNPEARTSMNEEGAVDGLPHSPPALAERVCSLSALDLLRSTDVFSSRWFSKYVAMYENAVEAIDPVTGFRDWGASEKAQDAAHFLANTPEWRMMRDVLGDDYEFGPFALASIDLQAPDDDLIDDFQNWLAQERRNRGIEPTPRAFAKTDLRLWTEMRVLAYIDLTTWARANCLKIGTALMGRVLFPKEYVVGVEDRVRKVVAREAQRLMDSRTLRTMQSQHLKADRKSDDFIPE